MKRHLGKFQKFTLNNLLFCIKTEDFDTVEHSPVFSKQSESRNQEKLEQRENTTRQNNVGKHSKAFLFMACLKYLQAVRIAEEAGGLSSG